MSHEIATINGQNAIAYFGSTPWHGLGQILTDGDRFDLDAAIRAAQLDWTVKTQPNFTLAPDGVNYVVNPFSQAVIRESDHAILGSVGPNTEVVQNREAFGILEPLVHEYGFTIETAGALYNGSQVWLLVKAPKSIEPVKGDTTDAYLLLRHAHDNTHTLEGIPTLIRVVCKNTSQAAVYAAGGNHTDKGRIFRIKKTTNVQGAVSAAKSFIKDFGKLLEETEHSLASLARTEISPAQIAQYIEDVFPFPLKAGKPVDSKTVAERRQEVARQVFLSPGAVLAGSDLETGRTTAYAVLQAVSFYLDHIRPEEAKSASAKAKAEASALFGANAATKLLAQAKAYQLVAA